MRVLSSPRVANATALLALVVAMGSTAYAANTVRSQDIVNGQVKTKDLAKNAVKSAQVKDGSLTAADLAAGAVPTTKAFQTSRAEYYTVPDGSGQHPVLTLDIPEAGRYVIFGKMTVDNDDNSTSTITTCRLTAGATFDEAEVGTDTDAAFDDQNPASLIATATFAGPGTAVLSCQKFTPTTVTQIAHREIVAIKVGSLVTTPAAGPKGSAKAHDAK